MAKTRVTQDLKFTNAKLLKDSLSRAGTTYIGVSRVTPWPGGVPQSVLGSAKERNEFEYELLGLQNVPAANVQYMIERNDWVSGQVYDMYRHDYSKNIRAASGAKRLEDCNYVVYTAKGEVYICLNNNGNRPSTVVPSSTLTLPFRTTDGYQWIRAYTLSSFQVNTYSSGLYIPVIPGTTPKTTVPGGVYSVVLNSIGKNYTTSPVGGINQIPAYFCKVLGDGRDAVARIEIVGGTVASVEIVRNGRDYTYATINFDKTSSYASIEDLDADENRLNPEGKGFDATVIIQPEGGFGENLYTDVSVSAIGVFGNLDYDILNEIDFPTFSQVGLITDPEFRNFNIPFDDISNGATQVNTAKAIAVDPVFGTNPLQVGEIIEQTINDLEDSPVARGTIVGIAENVEITEDKFVNVIRYVQNPEFHTDVDGNLYEFVGNNNILGDSSGGSARIVTSVNGVYNLLVFVGGYADAGYVRGSGDLVYLSNIQPVGRTPGQQEKVSFVINF
jgi:hypothetical protein